MTTTSAAITSAGTTLSVSSTYPATYDLPGFTALTWVNVGEITNMGAFGKKYALVTHQPVGTRSVVKRKGSYNNGTISFQMARAVFAGSGDAGQAILTTASTSDSSYAFKVTYPNGHLAYFSAQVMSFVTTVNTVDTILAATVDCELDNDVIES